MKKEEKITGKREVILKAAKESFARYGYAKTTLADIGKGAKLNKASLYYYYKNKESIFTDVILAESEEYMRSLQVQIAGERDFTRKIITYLKARLDYYRQVVNLHQLSVAFLREAEPIFDALYTEILAHEVEFIALILQEGAKQRYFKLVDFTQVARSLFTIADAVKFRAVQQSNVSDASQADYTGIANEIELITQLILNGIRVNPQTEQ